MVISLSVLFSPPPTINPASEGGLRKRARLPKSPALPDPPVAVELDFRCKPLPVLEGTKSRRFSEGAAEVALVVETALVRNFADLRVFLLQKTARHQKPDFQQVIRR